MIIAERLMLLASWLVPAAQKDWAAAMRVELGYIPDCGEAVKFAAGCLWFASWARSAAAWRGSPLELAIGACTGAVFVIHAFVPNSQSWPWLWPAIGGVSISIAQARRGQQLGWSVVSSGLKAGLVCAGVFLVAGAAMLAIAALHFGDAAVWRGAGLVAYGAFGALLLAPLSAAAATAVADRLR